MLLRPPADELQTFIDVVGALMVEHPARYGVELAFVPQSAARSGDLVGHPSSGVMAPCGPWCCLLLRRS